MSLQDHLNTIDDLVSGDINPISIISQEVTEFDIVNHLNDKYEVITLKDSKSWKSFIDWFHPTISTSSLFSKFNERIMVINTDILTRIPKEKTDKQKNSPSSVYNLIKFIQSRCPIKKVIFVTEKSKNEYKLQVRPFILGTVLDYSDPLFIAKTILHNKSIEDTIDILNKHGNFYDPAIIIVSDYLLRHDPDKLKVSEAINVYYKLRFNADNKTIVKYIATIFKTKMKYVVKLPPYFYKTFQYITTTPKILNSL